MSNLAIDYEVESRVGILTIDRPPVNAIRLEDVERLDQFLNELPNEDELALVIRTGGNIFMAGHDINEFHETDGSSPPEWDPYRSFVQTIYEFPVPTIAAVDGPAAGIGAIISSLCDIRVASPDATFSLPEIDVGIIGGLGPLRRVLPDGVVRWMTFTGESISGERAHQLGMVAKVAPDAEGEAVEMANTIASKSPSAVRKGKALAIEEQPDWPIEDYHREVEFGEQHMTHEHTVEAIAAVVEDRDPEFDA
ncbi:enoyl-CoA hydratase/isomerase family protein [Natrinema halophilum]|uniref:enoyl-CoA hydratase/isomerase family protein n=1 Tax=Natrinema halophilum TaxID=1699371 RepID=UPI001F48B11D|nr:enoyl-CoA hydratase/isomerase family protein [Natrinema halophilum]UHQ96292.1 enoyl-CoA hydratase/isomerase family protein [Natrinema halophilum]